MLDSLSGTLCLCCSAMRSRGRIVGLTCHIRRHFFGESTFLAPPVAVPLELFSVTLQACLGGAGAFVCVHLRPLLNVFY
jgi:hypothetical protein